MKLNQKEKIAEYSVGQESKAEKLHVHLPYCSPNYTLFFPHVSSSLIPGIIKTILFSEAEESKGLRKPRQPRMQLLIADITALISVRELSFPYIQDTD